MKHLNLLLLLLALPLSHLASAQPAKTKILLLGTIHFETPHKDRYELKTDDFRSPRRQQELEALTAVLARTHARQVMIERPHKRQAAVDSLYGQYLAGRYALAVSEREQLGFRLARKLGLPHITCVDELSTNPHDSLMAATAASQPTLLRDMGMAATALLGTFDAELKKGTLTDVLRFINQPAQLRANLALYLQYMARIGAGQNFAGAGAVSDWYLRNLMIYANIISQVRPGDGYVVLIFGQGHIPILKHLLENNDQFEVVDVQAALR
ncbi:DUF5694 domain-containing protein [Hymenobacter ruricola]|uniref:TraB/GumN family protein n=1 Tax=Hymenobacter ruricola TaxID=2791023 RepID=A0ABS0HZR7_9BACT|nr:DUF5694 domain-containing protein [Hymenobacter ruricola]MBF9220193.1 hypothetical protein [Hymenobacter ruricola]